MSLGSESTAAKFFVGQNECRILREKLAVAEAKLKTLENVIAPALDEYQLLQQQFEIEKECRNEAEKYAAKMRKQNVNLKRQSQQILGMMKTVNISFDDADSQVPELSVDETARDALNSKIRALEETVRDQQSKIDAAETYKLATYERETQLTAKIQFLEDQLQDAEQKIADYNQSLSSIKRVSSSAWQEFEELQENYEREIALRLEAEAYAHKMKSGYDAVKRESAILLQSVEGDERLSSALLSVEELSIKMALQERDYQLQIEALKTEIDSSATNKLIADLQNKLQLAVTENERLQKLVKELEKWKAKLEKENIDLTNKLDVAEQMLRPPPPPPPPLPPPPSIFSPLRLLIKKKSPATSDATSAKPKSAKEQTYEEALKEMMERIKSGKPLKSTVVSQEKQPQVTQAPSAMENLKQLLVNKPTASADTSDSPSSLSIEERIKRQKSWRAAHETSEATELTKKFQKLASQSSQIHGPADT